MKKILFLFIMVMGLMSSLYALDTGQAVGCDIEKSQWGEGADAKMVIPSDATYSSLEHEYATVQAYFDSTKLSLEHSEMILRHEKIATLLTKVDICIINGGYSNFMGEGGV